MEVVVFGTIVWRIGIRNHCFPSAGSLHERWWTEKFSQKKGDNYELTIRLAAQFALQIQEVSICRQSRQKAPPATQNASQKS